MDSITQIVLGAAVGETVLGKKIGNRAMVWGAVAGTIPDLDIIGNLFMSEIDALAFHRGISHSILFSIIGAFVFSWMVHRMYESQYSRKIGMVGWSLLPVSIGALLIKSGIEAGKYTTSVIGLTIALLGTYISIHRHASNRYKKPNARLKDWQWLFFWGLLTHPLLDTFTAYGTQLFAPFSDYRAAFSNISVADPIYTILFATPLVILAFYHKSKPIRRKLVYTGIILSSLYMCFTLYNKYRISQIMEDTLVQDNIPYTRYFTSPSILNNILWSGVAETETSYYHGQYSFFDKERKFKLQKLDKREYLIANAKPDDKVINTLKWFSNGYNSMLKLEGDTIQINDMRYGTFRGKGDQADDFIFHFPIVMQEDGYYKLIKTQGGPRDDVDMGEMAKDLWTRINGI